METYKEICLEQIEILEKLVEQNQRLLLLLGQYTDVAEEERHLKTLTRTMKDK